MTLLGPDGRPIYSTKRQSRVDGWWNPHTDYGGQDDNIENTAYYTDYRLIESEINALYENGGVWARAVEAPIKDRLAKGITFLTNDDDSDARRAEVERAENDLMSHIWEKYIEASFWGRKDGGGLLYFDYGDDRFPESLDRGINFELQDSQRGVPNKIWVLDRWQAIPQSYYTTAVHGADHPKLGEVEIYSLNLLTTGESRQVFAHESRCVKIDGLPISPSQRAANLMWGISIFQRIYKVMRFLGISLKSMTDILETWNYVGVGIPDLAEKLISNSTENIQLMLKSIGAAAKSTHNQNVAIFDKDGGMINKSGQSATGIVDIVGALINFYCGEVGVPYSRLFSSEGGALAGTAADTDIKNYHESLRFDQKYKDTPAIQRCLWLLGYEYESFPFAWSPLKETTRLEQIEERKAQMEVDGGYVDMGALDPVKEVRPSRFSTPEMNLDQTIIDHDLDDMVEQDEEGQPEEEQEQENDNQDNRTDSEKPIEVRAVIQKRIVQPTNIKIGA